MGNQPTKESGGERRPGGSSSQAGQDHDRQRRVSRGELSFLGIASSSGGRDRTRRRGEDAPFTHRETKAEREARKLARERELRAIERERSMKEEHVDGGYLITLGTYTGTEDYSKPVVRQLLIERKMAPFWQGLNDWSDNWTEYQLVAAARGLPIPAADDIPDPDLLPRPPPKSDSKQSLQNLTVPMGPRTMSASSDVSGSAPGSGTQSPSGRISKSGRAKALAAALSIGSRNASSTDLAPRETMLPHDPFVNGQPIEVYLYKDATECPICFLTYPPYLNQTRCCDQPICSECFVQIKRTEPHLPEHHPDGQARDPNEGLNPEDPPEMLISEPAACPYCQQPEFGVTYTPPPFRRGLVYGSTSSGLHSMTPSQTSLHSPPLSAPPTGRRRGHSLSVNAPNVITTDRVRPDWKTKLDNARQHQARRAAAATALHTAAFLVNGENESRSILRPGRFSRRNTGQNAAATGSGTASNERLAEPNTTVAPPPSEGQSGPRPRRSRMEELEEMMLMEAMRLSIASEEERQRKEEKALRKDAKKREKEEKKKAAKNKGSDPYGGGASASGSSLSLGGFGRRRGNSAASALRMEATVQGAAQTAGGATSPTKAAAPTPLETSEEVKEDESSAKGKEVDRGLSSEATSSDVTPATEESSPFGSLPIPGASGRRGSHLRQMSNASSLDSSPADSPAGSYGGPGYQGPEEGQSRRDRDEGEDINGPMFNFNSIAELVGINLDDGTVQRRDEDGKQDGDDVPRTTQQSGKESPKAEHAEHAEHVEESSQPAKQEGQYPGVIVTPETPIEPETGRGEDKRLGHSSVAEHATPISH